MVAEWVVLAELNSASDHKDIEFTVYTGITTSLETSPDVQSG